jgi:choline kinase
VAPKSRPRPRALILLAAGQGSRLRPLTESIPKCLLPIGEHTVLDVILQNFLQDEGREIVIVGGHGFDGLVQYLNDNYPDGHISIVDNSNYANDTNILSMDIGVNALKDISAGYTVIETDLVLSPKGWTIVKEAEDAANSFWVTSGRYSSVLTGGIVRVSEVEGWIEEIAYVPKFDASYEGWHKMVGILSVAFQDVELDRKFRRELLTKGSQHYYMAPWSQNLSHLPCKAVDLGVEFAKSFNTPEEYFRASNGYLLCSEG